MLIWITGARGFIGQHLARYLLDVDEEVKAVGIGHGRLTAAQSKALGLSCWVNADVDAANLEHLKSKTGMPSIIFHLAGGSAVGASFVNPFEDFRRTVTSAATVLEWIRQNVPECRFVFASSAAVYGNLHTEPIVESARKIPFSPYGSHKFMVEELCRSYSVNFGLDTRVARPFSVYGEGLEKQLVFDLCQRLAANENPIKLGGTGTETRDWIHVSDVVKGLYRLATLDDGANLTVNLGTGVQTQVQEIASVIAHEWSPDHRIEFDGKPRTGDPHQLVADVTRLNLLRVDIPVGWQQGVKQVVQWYREYYRSAN